MTTFNGGGAFRNGPWINERAKRWDETTKISIRGSVRRRATFSQKLSGSKLVLTGNGLPSSAGAFPVQSSDPAYQYDRNPNSIRSYTLRVELPANPTIARKPTCVGGTIGVMKDGIPLYSAFDALGRDAGAHEVQDRCGGHPEITGQYHHHTLPPCLDTGPKATESPLIGYALDGFGIYGPRSPGGRVVTTADLDVCHGTTSEVNWRGRRVSVYHYVATNDFPYVVSCFRGTPITSAQGLHIGPPGAGGGAPPGPPGAPPPP